MRNLKLVLGVILLAVAVTVGSQVGKWELANYELQDDLRDMASEAGVHVGFAPPETDHQLQQSVASKARHYGIPLDPTQVTVGRFGPRDASRLYLAADYTVPVTLPGFGFAIHFTPSSGEKE